MMLGFYSTLAAVKRAGQKQRQTKGTN